MDTFEQSTTAFIPAHIWEWHIWEIYGDFLNNTYCWSCVPVYPGWAPLLPQGQRYASFGWEEPLKTLEVTNFACGLFSCWLCVSDPISYTKSFPDFFLWLAQTNLLRFKSYSNDSNHSNHWLNILYKYSNTNASSSNNHTISSTLIVLTLDSILPTTLVGRWYHLANGSIVAMKMKSLT